MEWQREDRRLGKGGQTEEQRRQVDRTMQIGRHARKRRLALTEKKA